MARCKLDFCLLGGAFGILICINHLWRAFNRRFQWHFSKHVAWALTFLLVVHCWVLFRASTMEQALQILSSMYQMPDISQLITYKMRVIVIIALVAACKLLPESWEFIEFKNVRKRSYKIAVCFIMMAISIFMMNTTPSEFLYFQF